MLSPTQIFFNTNVKIDIENFGTFITTIMSKKCLYMILCVIANVINPITIFDKQANVNICENCQYAKCVMLTNQSLIVKTEEIANILMDNIFWYIFC